MYVNDVPLSMRAFLFIFTVPVFERWCLSVVMNYVSDIHECYE